MEPRTVLYKEFLAERQEILRHKWIESEKAGYDIGFEHALFDWTLKYRSAWLEKRLQRMAEHELREQPNFTTGPRTKLMRGEVHDLRDVERSERSL